MTNQLHGVHSVLFIRTINVDSNLYTHLLVDWYIFNSVVRYIVIGSVNFNFLYFWCVGFCTCNCIIPSVSYCLCVFLKLCWNCTTGINNSCYLSSVKPHCLHSIVTLCLFQAGINYWTSCMVRMMKANITYTNLNWLVYGVPNRLEFV